MGRMALDRAARRRAALQRDGATCVWCGRAFTGWSRPRPSTSSPGSRAVRRGRRTRWPPAGAATPTAATAARSSGWRSASAAAGSRTRPGWPGRWPLLADAIAREGGQRRARPYLDAQLRRMRRRARRGTAGLASPVGEQRVVGRVEQIWVYPVKSLAGTAGAAAVEVGPARAGRGPGLDASSSDDGGRVRAKDAPALADAAGTGDPRRRRRRCRAAARAAGAPGGRRPRPAPASPPVHLVSRQAIERAAARRRPGGLLGRRPARQPAARPRRRRRRAHLGRPQLRVGRRRPRGHPDAEALPGRLRRGAPAPAGSPSGTPSCSSLPPCRTSRAAVPGRARAAARRLRRPSRPRRRRQPAAVAATARAAAAGELHARRDRRRADPPGPGAHRRGAAGRRQLRLLRRPRPGRPADRGRRPRDLPPRDAGRRRRAGPYRGYPSFAVQPEIVDALAGAGYDLCSTASNHSLDDGARRAGPHPRRPRRGRDRAHRHVPDRGGRARAADRRRRRRAGRARRRRRSASTAVPLPAGREWSVDVADVPDVDADAGRGGPGARRRRGGRRRQPALLPGVRQRPDRRRRWPPSARCWPRRTSTSCSATTPTSCSRSSGSTGSGRPTGSATTSPSTRPAATRPRTR